MHIDLNECKSFFTKRLKDAYPSLYFNFEIHENVLEISTLIFDKIIDNYTLFTIMSYNELKSNEGIVDFLINFIYDVEEPTICKDICTILRLLKGFNLNIKFSK